MNISPIKREWKIRVLKPKPISCNLYFPNKQELSENGDEDKNRISHDYPLEILTQFKCRTVFLTFILGEYCPSLNTMTRWYKQFKSGNFGVEDDPRSGRPAEAVVLENVAAVEKLLNKDRRINYRQI